LPRSARLWRRRESLARPWMKPVKWITLIACLLSVLAWYAIGWVRPHGGRISRWHWDLTYPVCSIPVIVVLAGATVVLWCLDRPGPGPGHCANCGYDLTGNVSGRCPECGTPVGKTRS